MILWGGIRRLAFRLAPLSATLLLSGCDWAVLNPKGPIADGNATLLVDSVAIMLVIVVPTIVATLAAAWWYRSSNTRAQYLPDWEYSGQLELIVWAIPLLTIMLLGGVTWIGAHDLDPAKPIVSKEAPLNIQVVSLDWKWLFIYPDLNVASVNQLTIPVGTPVSFELTSSGVMNSFFVPQLGSQIYTMAGMVSHLQLRADDPGTYRGMSAQFSGDGFSDMHFNVDAVPAEKFAQWVDLARSAGPELDAKTYADLAKPSGAVTPFTYRAVAPDLFGSIMVSQMQSDDAMCRSYPKSMRAEQ